MKTKKDILMPIIVLALLITILCGGISVIVVTTSTGKKVPESTGKYSSILSLKYDGYEKDSLGVFRNKALSARDEQDELPQLMEDAYSDNSILIKRYIDPDASFVCNVAIALSADKWDNYRANGYHTSSDGQIVLEFEIDYNIINPDKLTVAIFESSINEIASSIGKFVSQHSDETNGDSLQKDIDLLGKQLSKQYSTDNILFKVSLYADEYSDSPSIALGSAQKEVDVISASRKDIAKLIDTFRKDGYEDMNVRAYRDFVSSKTDSKLSKTIDSLKYDFAENKSNIKELSQEDYDFLYYIFLTTINENAWENKQRYVEEPEELYFRVQGYTKKPALYIDYRLYYDISNIDIVTIGTRTEVLKNTILDIQNGITDIIKNGNAYPENLSALSDEIASKYSTTECSVKIDEIQYRPL